MTCLLSFALRGISRDGEGEDVYRKNKYTTFFACGK